MGVGERVRRGRQSERRCVLWWLFSDGVGNGLGRYGLICNLEMRRRVDLTCVHGDRKTASRLSEIVPGVRRQQHWISRNGLKELMRQRPLLGAIRQDDTYCDSSLRTV